MAHKWLKKRFAVKPNDASNFALRGDAYFGQGKYQEAVKDFEKAHELDDKNALMLVKLSSAYVMAGRIPDGKKAIIKARRLDPKDPDARFYYASHIWEKDPTNALKELDKAMKLDPSHKDAPVLMGKILFVLNRPAEAREILTKYLRENPGESRATSLMREYQNMR